MYIRVAAFLSIALLAFALTGCPEPKFPDAPFINFKGINSIERPNKDSLIITISFRDGYGDLGLGPYDTLAPFDQEPFRYNYHITAFKKLGVDDEGRPNFVPVEFPTAGITFNGRFPILKPDGKPGPIEGDLNYSIPIEFPQDFTNERYILPGDTLRFDIFIYDRGEQDAARNNGTRNPNRSNQITTGEVVVLKR
jgi:hypothetical protein